MVPKGADGIDLTHSSVPGEAPGPELVIQLDELGERPLVVPSAAPPAVIDLREAPADDQLELAAARRPYLTGQLLRADDEILAARRLHAQIYLSSGFVEDGDISPDGTLQPDVDPWAGQSEYFAVVREGRTMVTARQIHAGEAKELPALTLSELEAEEVRQILDLPVDTAVEISALARNQGASSADVVAVYVRMWQESLDREHRVWVMAVDLRVFQLLRAAICGGAIRAIGAHQDYMGSVVVPAVIWLDELRVEQEKLAARSPAPYSLARLLPGLFGAPAYGRSR